MLVRGFELHQAVTPGACVLFSASIPARGIQARGIPALKLRNTMFTQDVLVQQHGAVVRSIISSCLEGGGALQLYYHDCSGRIPDHKGATGRVLGFELETNCCQFYALPTWTRHP